MPAIWQIAKKGQRILEIKIIIFVINESKLYPRYINVLFKYMSSTPFHESKLLFTMRITYKSTLFMSKILICSFLIKIHHPANSKHWRPFCGTSEHR